MNRPNKIGVIGIPIYFKSLLLIFLFTLILDCTLYGQLYCDGDVVKTFTSLVRVCERGVLKYKKKSQLYTKDEEDIRQEVKGESKTSQENDIQNQQEGNGEVQQGGKENVSVA